MKLVTHKQSKAYSVLLAVILISIIVSGCASSPKALNILRAGDAITIQLPLDIESEHEFFFSNMKASDFINKGTSDNNDALAGIGIGGMSLLCGPAVFVCSGIGGLYYGINTVENKKIEVVAGPKTDLSVYRSEHLKIINQKVDSYVISKKPQNLFLSLVSEHASERYQISSLPTDTKITVLFTGMGLNYLGDDTVALITQSFVTVNYIDQSGKSQEVSAVFQYISPPNNIESWANENENFYRQRFEQAYRAMAEDIVMTLSY